MWNGSCANCDVHWASASFTVPVTQFTLYDVRRRVEDERATREGLEGRHERASGRRGYFMCKLEDAARLESVILSLRDNDNARALVRLLSYAADEAEHLKSDLAALLIRASIDALSVEINGGTRPAETGAVRMTLGGGGTF